MFQLLTCTDQRSCTFLKNGLLQSVGSAGIWCFRCLISKPRKNSSLINGGRPFAAVYGQNGNKSKRRQVKTATPKWRQKWLYSKRRQTQTTPTVLEKPI